MAIVGALSTIPALARRRAVFLDSRDYVLVLSHMRSYSSMLGHVLGDEMAAYAESGFGDSSNRMTSGRIDRQAEPPAVPDVPPRLLEAAWAAHQQWRAAGERHRVASPVPTAS